MIAVEVGVGVIEAVGVAVEVGVGVWVSVGEAFGSGMIRATKLSKFPAWPLNVV
jgi:hypothetical protein